MKTSNNIIISLFLVSLSFIDQTFSTEVEVSYYQT